MRKFPRLVIVICGLGMLGQAMWLWQSTGRRWFTQYYRADLDPANIATGPLDATLDAAGIYDAAGRPEVVDFQFHLGLVPSGFGTQLMSAMTLGGLGVLAGIAAAWPPRPGVIKP